MRDHYEGFEKEEQFHLILSRALDDCPTIKARTIKRIIHQVAPDFMEGLFVPRPCVRRLRYVGCGDVCCEFPTSEAPHGNGLVLGQVYESELFNGATYKLRDRDGWVGAAHFEWVRDFSRFLNNTSPIPDVFLKIRYAILKIRIRFHPVFSTTRTKEECFQ